MSIKLVEEKNNSNATIKLIDESNNEVLATARTQFAEESQLKSIAKIDTDVLKQCIFIEDVTINSQQDSTLLHSVLYFALRRARICGRQNVVAFSENQDPDVLNALHLKPLSNLNKVVASRLKFSILRLYNACSDDIKQVIKSSFMSEILEVHNQWLDKFFSGSWIKTIMGGTLTREQYVCCLQNLHSYVRQTTRLAARGIAYSKENDLRDHYIYHLRGEINHEIMIERDLKNLGEDINYVINEFIPSPETKEFMVVQESTIGFYRDPLLMLACPLVAEGMTAHLERDSKFIEALYNNIKRWGVTEPKDVSRFLTSHINTDGGEDGHWKALQKTITKFLSDELTQQKFLSVMTAAENGFLRSFNASVDNMKLWSAEPVAS